MVPVGCPSLGYLSSSRHALLCPHRGRFLRAADSRLCCLLSACRCCGRLTEAKPAPTVKVLRFAVTLISSEKWLQICGQVPVPAPPPRSGEGEFLSENNIAGARPVSPCLSRVRNGLMNPAPEGRNGLLWAQALCYSCDFAPSGISRSPASPCGSAWGCRPCVSVPGRHSTLLPSRCCSSASGQALLGEGWCLGCGALRVAGCR